MVQEKNIRIYKDDTPIVPEIRPEERYLTQVRNILREHIALSLERYKKNELQVKG